MAVFDRTLFDVGLSFLRDSPNRTPTIIIEDGPANKIAVLDAAATGNNGFTGDVNTPDFRYSIYYTGNTVNVTNSHLTPLPRGGQTRLYFNSDGVTNTSILQTGNFLNPQAGYAAHGNNFYFNSIPPQMLLANTTMACGLLCNVVSDGANSVGEFTGYMHSLNNWNRSLFGYYTPATKNFQHLQGSGGNNFAYVVFPTSTTNRAGSAAENDVNTQIRYFDIGSSTNSTQNIPLANGIIGGTGAGTTWAASAGAQQTTTPWWSTYNVDFIGYNGSADKLVGVTVRNGSTSTTQKVQPGGGGLIAINNARQSTGAYANLYPVANSTTGRAANTLGLETNPSLTFVGYGGGGAKGNTYLFINTRVASFSAGLVDVSTNTFQNAVAFTITSGTDNKWCGTPSYTYLRNGDVSGTTNRFCMSEIQAANAGRRIREYVVTYGNAVATAQGNSVTFANTDWAAPLNTTAHTDSSPLYGYLATVTSLFTTSENFTSERDLGIEAGSPNTYITQIPIETWNRPSTFLTTNAAIRWATAYLTDTGNGIVAVDSANSYLPTEPPLAVYPISSGGTKLLAMYNEYAEILKLGPIPGTSPVVMGKWEKVLTYPYPLRTVSAERKQVWGNTTNNTHKPVRIWAYDKNGILHMIPIGAYASFTLSNTNYEYTGNTISTSGRLRVNDLFDTRFEGPLSNTSNVQIVLSGGGVRFADNTTIAYVTVPNNSATQVYADIGGVNTWLGQEVPLQVVGPGATQITVNVMAESKG